MMRLHNRLSVAVAVPASEQAHAAVRGVGRVHGDPHPDAAAALLQVEVRLVLVPRLLAPAACRLEQRHVLEELRRFTYDSLYSFEKKRMVR